ncbi:cytochrome C peroxidase [Nostoc sp. XA010]|uniref:cytochrome-c peroxidase n=1 Tax=Nostoc sp. XA010 TaxID=2780407 RepID=UPI001E3B2D14|nr:cytochrome c peroxidase [Nostoc sp. XA010]MCC5656710.1 cytochrome C peroxidase [Nostoc sp. XA010]
MIRSNTALAILIVLILMLFWIYLRYKTRILSRYSRPLAIFVIVSLVSAGGGIVSAQVTRNPTPLNNITSLPPTTSGDPTPANPPLLTAVAEPSNLGDFVADQTALLKLGKALFWDMQLGSDGVQSCASCHFHAGVDNRSKNQISPGVLASVKDKTFQVGGGANYQLTAADFPFHKLADPNDRTSTVISDSNDVASSQGVFYSVIKDTVPGQAVDSTTSKPDSDGFQVNGINVRRVEPRNTPTVIDTIFNKLQFWDGRAKESFNGVNIKGAADPSAKVYKATKPNQLTAVSVSLNNSSIASLVTGPLLSEFETSAEGRTLPQVGAKFLRKKGQRIKSLRPLGKQLVHQQDSVLGSDSRSPQTGLAIASYDQLIRKAFKKEWWKSKSIIQVDSNGTPTILAKNNDDNESEEGQTLPANQFSLRDWNFSLFSGLAMQKYMSTLVSGNTPFDKFQAGNINALTDQEKSGLTVFVNNTANGGGNCNTCHTIPEFTRASVRRTAGVASTDPSDPLISNATNGFFGNYGVRPASDDPGAGNTTTSLFKAPALRNIGLTAPYMHNGGMATLEQVVDFYNRGRGDDGGPGVPPLNLTDAKKADLVAFLRKGLTDQRVLLEQAPFDHPQLFIPNGHPGNQNSVTSSGNTNGTPTATDQPVEIPAVGRNGVTTPKPNFLE